METRPGVSVCAWRHRVPTSLHDTWKGYHFSGNAERDPRVSRWYPGRRLRSRPLVCLPARARRFQGNHSGLQPMGGGANRQTWVCDRQRREVCVRGRHADSLLGRTNGFVGQGANRLRGAPHAAPGHQHHAPARFEQSRQRRPIFRKTRLPDRQTWGEWDLYHPRFALSFDSPVQGERQHPGPAEWRHRPLHAVLQRARRRSHARPHDQHFHPPEPLHWEALL